MSETPVTLTDEQKQAAYQRCLAARQAAGFTAQPTYEQWLARYNHAGN